VLQRIDPLTPPPSQLASKPSVWLTSSFRTVALLSAVFVTMAAAIVAALFWQTNALISAQTLNVLAAERADLQRVVQGGGLDALLQAVASRVLPPRSGRPAALYAIVDARNQQVVGNLSWPKELDDTSPGGSFRYDSGQHGVGLVLKLTDGSRLLVARNIDEQRAVLDHLRWNFLLGFGTLSLLGIGAGLAAGRHLLRRIATITDTADTIMAGDFSRRVPLSARVAAHGEGDEFDHLSIRLNSMLERIEQLMGGLKEVSDNIAHDLKTPLNRLRNRAEAALREGSGREGTVREGAGTTATVTHKAALERVIEDADDLIKTFNALLLIARLEAGSIADSFEAFDLGALVTDVGELYEAVAEDAGIAFKLAQPATVMVRANRQLIGQALANLIDNAMKYGVPTAEALKRGITPEITLAMTATATTIELSIADRGPGIPAEDRDRALRRFVRLDQSRTKPGTGLGLRLVAAVARLHGGTMRLEDNAPGLRIVLVLDAAAVKVSA
jgi:signal transduction histidine kinase